MFPPCIVAILGIFDYLRISLDQRPYMVGFCGLQCARLLSQVYAMRLREPDE